MGAPATPDGSLRVVLAVGDPRVGQAVERAARQAGVQVAVAEDPEGAEAQGVQDPLVVVLDVEAEDPRAALSRWRSRWPEVLALGVVQHPERDRWVAAERAGFDRVVNGGAVGRVLRDLLVAGRGRRWFPVVEDADAAGRLGLLAELPDSPIGPLAVYRVAGELVCVPDRCPHAGAALSRGTLEGSVLTCPGHGSQFDLCTGARLRGPADQELTIRRPVLRQGRWCLPIDPGDAAGPP